MWGWKFNNCCKTTSLPLGIKQSFWLHFILHRHNILLPKGGGKTHKFLTGSDLRYLYHLKEFQKIVQRNHLKANYITLHYIGFTCQTPNSIRMEDQFTWRSQWVSLGGILKKKKRKKEKQKVDIDQHLCTYSTPCSRMQGYFILW